VRGRADTIGAMTSPETLGRALAAAPDPERARVALSRVGEDPRARDALADPVVLERAVPILGLSTSVADFLVAYPEEAALFADLDPRALPELLDEARGDVESLGAEPGLRRFRRRAMARIAARDLAGEPVEEVVAEISAAAEACLEVALQVVDGADMAVLGMGKLGGAELNYASDVDVLFVHPDAGGDRQERAGKVAARFMRLLSDPTRDGIALRVDADLRPEGRAGALSRSLPAMLDYYERHAATWERQALLKVRPVAGDRALGEAFIEGVAPFVYPERLDPAAIEEIRRMKARVEEHVRGRGGRDVKRSPGGIRDVEFAVQLLQLVHGRRDATLRRAGTLPALRALADGGYVAENDAGQLAGSYRFLRTLEHRLQLVRDLQTHDLPEDPASLRVLARSMGLADEGALKGEHARHADIVRGLHEKVFYRPLLEAFAGDEPHPGVDRPATEELLAGLGFADPAGAYRVLERLIEPGTRMGKVLGTSLPLVLPSLAAAANPDRALVRFERVTEPLRGDPDLADTLMSEPAALRDLGALVAASDHFSDALVRRPDAVRWLGRDDEPPDDPEAALIRLAGRYAAGELHVPDAGRALSAVADRVISLAVAEADPQVPLAVIGLGKLGGEELNFASDLDVLFVHEGEGSEDFQAAEGAAERILAGIRAQGYEADPDLRPEGRNGPLTRSVASYLEYWERWALLWEFQSLLKARPVAGDEGLGRRFVSLTADFAYPESLSVDSVAEVRRMRVRMEEERVRPPEARRFHFKLGYGGLADVQFAVELSLLRYGGAHPEIRRRHPLEAIEALAAARLVEDSVALSLSEAYVFLNEIKNALEIERRISAESIPPLPEDQAVLARRLGYEERSRFMEDYRRITRRARLAMERVFYGEDL
jgi:glutamate-ammonia-ligase adenylyltransferase